MHFLGNKPPPQHRHAQLLYVFLTAFGEGREHPLVKFLGESPAGLLFGNALCLSLLFEDLFPGDLFDELATKIATRLSYRAHVIASLSPHVGFRGVEPLVADQQLLGRRVIGVTSGSHPDRLLVADRIGRNVTGKLDLQADVIGRFHRGELDLAAGQRRAAHLGAQNEIADRLALGYRLRQIIECGDRNLRHNVRSAVAGANHLQQPGSLPLILDHAQRLAHLPRCFDGGVFQVTTQLFLQTFHIGFVNGARVATSGQRVPESELSITLDRPGGLQEDGRLQTGLIGMETTQHRIQVLQRLAIDRHVVLEMRREQVPSQILFPALGRVGPVNGLLQLSGAVQQLLADGRKSLGVHRSMLAPKGPHQAGQILCGVLDQHAEPMLQLPSHGRETSHLQPGNARLILLKHFGDRRQIGVRTKGQLPTQLFAVQESAPLVAFGLRTDPGVQLVQGGLHAGYVVGIGSGDEPRNTQHDAEGKERVQKVPDRLAHDVFSITGRRVSEQVEKCRPKSI